MLDLSSKVVFITGSSSGIGEETAYMFAKENSILVITYITNKEKSAKIARSCMDLGAKETYLVKLDLTKDVSINSAVKKIITKFNHIDILINNAGVIEWNPLGKQTFSTIEQQSRVNFEGLMKMTLACLPYIKSTIINIASRAGKIPHPGLSVYCATKFGVRGFTQTLALEYPKLNIYSVNPDSTATRMTNYLGRSPEKVAFIILKTAQGHYNLKSGSDVDVWTISRAN